MLRERVHMLRRSGLVEGSQEGIPEQLGDFRILERLGEGGMGVVYRALQLSLGREVALKLIRPEQIYFGNARERFQVEVETIAGLHHPGIVAVHAVGEESGVPYFAMELVRGRSIEGLLEDLKGREPDSLVGADLDPSGDGGSYLFEGDWEQACMRIVRQLCEALQFAHDRGVLHRDLKPSNIMIASEGPARALLLDFGLARSKRSSKLTASGSQLGSLRYMSPEQVRADSDSLGPATDVYGLGVTLYEMLTLAPAFDGDTTQVLLAVTQQGLPRLRTRNPRCSWEAETILSKATDPDPRRRYPSAADMGRDLANALEKRPIEARRSGTALRLRRWAQRHPARALAATLGLLLFVGVPAGYAWQQRQAARLIGEQRDAAVRAFGSAMEAVDQMLSRVGGDDLAYVPAMEQLRRRLLEDAVALLERVVAEGVLYVEREGRLELAEARGHLGRLFFQLGRSSEGLPHYEEGRRILAELLASEPDDLRAVTLQASLTIEFAMTSRAAGELERALALQEELSRSLAARGDANAFRGQAARNRAELAITLAELGRRVEAGAAFAQACGQLDGLARAQDATLADLMAAASSWNQFGTFWLDPGAASVDERAFPPLERGLELARELVGRDPAPQNQTLLCSALNNMSGALRRRQEFEPAAALLQEARSVLEALVLDHPSTLTFELELATVVNQIGLLYTGQQRPGEALPYYRECSRHLAKLCALAPEEPTYHQRLAVSHHNQASMLRETGAPLVEQEQVVAVGIASIRRAIELAPDSVDYWESAMALYSQQVGIVMAQDDYPRMLEISDEMVELVPGLGEAWHRAAYHHAKACEIARTDEWLTPEEREEAVQRYAQRSCELTREAVLHGAKYQNLRALRNLEGLHGLAVFEELCGWFESLDAARRRGSRTSHTAPRTRPGSTPSGVEPSNNPPGHAPSPCEPRAPV